jgi:tetratricopeptide (TPR) repeat protein
MSSSRIDMLLGFIRQKPSDPFPRYALALEYKNAGRLDEARTEFDTLLRDHGDYTAGYLHAGNLYLALGLKGEASAIYQRGIDVCIRRADTHARGELEGALAALA